MVRDYILDACADLEVEWSGVGVPSDLLDSHSKVARIMHCPTSSL